MPALLGHLRRDWWLAVKIVGPALLILGLAIICFEGAADCVGDMKNVMSLTLVPKSAVAVSATTLLVMAAHLVLYGSALLFLVYSIQTIREYRPDGGALPLIALAVGMGLMGGLGLLMFAQKDLSGACYGQEYFSIPRSILEKYFPKHPILKDIGGVQVASLIFIAGVLLSNIGYWAMGMALSAVLPSHRNPEALKDEEYLKRCKKKIETLFVCCSVFFIVCVLALSLWLRLPWDALEGGDAYYRYPATLTIYYGVTMSFLIVVSYLIAVHHYRSVSQPKEGSDLLSGLLGGDGAETEFTLFAEVRRFAVFLGPLWTSLLPFLTDQFFS